MANLKKLENPLKRKFWHALFQLALITKHENILDYDRD